VARHGDFWHYKLGTSWELSGEKFYSDGNDFYTEKRLEEDLERIARTPDSREHGGARRGR